MRSSHFDQNLVVSQTIRPNGDYYFLKLNTDFFKQQQNSEYKTKL